LSSNGRGAPVQYLLLYCCYNYLRGPCAGAWPPSLVVFPLLPPASHGPGALCCGKGFGKTMNTGCYAMIYIVAAAVGVTVAFLVVIALTS